MSQNGNQVRWRDPVKIPLAGNPSNQSGITDTAFFSAVVRGLQRWQSASAGKANFDYWQGSDTSVYAPNSDYNGLSSIYFASSAGGAGISNNVLGLTQVWYNTDTGEILEADIVLNDLSYHFSTNVRDTSGYGSQSSGYGRNVYIENVITHELGHAFGLSHSAGMQSTMLFMESPEQAYLGCDDQIAIRFLYPGDDNGVRGALRGSVVSETNGASIFGAHVLAISRKRGTVLATAITDSSGNYSINALEPGSYFLIAEPFFAGASALPSYYSSINSRVCGTKSFSRTLLTDGDPNRPHSINVSAGDVTSAPPIQAKCDPSGGAAIIQSTSNNPVSAPIVFDGTSQPSGGFGFADKFGSSGTIYHRLRSVAGRIEVHAMGYSLYSPIHPSVYLIDSDGRSVDTERNEYVYNGNSGYVNYDSSLVASDLPSGDYYIKISASSLSASVYPAGPTALDQVPFLLITGSVNENGSPALAASLAVNARCKMAEDFPAYSSPPGGPQRKSVSNNDEEEDDDGWGFCSFLTTRDTNSKNNQGPSAGAAVGWFLPWLFILVVLRSARRVEIYKKLQLS